MKKSADSTCFVRENRRLRRAKQNYAVGSKQ
jgi:hypothetical protein